MGGVMCDVCNGHSGCPVCSKEPYYVKCPDCNGEGYLFYTEIGEDMTRDDFYSRSGGIIEKCPICDGEGEIIDDDDRLE